MGRQLKSPLGAEVTLNLGKQIQPQQSPPHHKNYSQSVSFFVTYLFFSNHQYFNHHF